MTRAFVNISWFDKQWKALGFDDNDLLRLQKYLLANPDAGKVIEGTGGIRKLRFSFENRGKSGSTRVIYVDFIVYKKIYLLTAYGKNQKENLSAAEKNDLRKVVEAIENELRKGRSS